MSNNLVTGPEHDEDALRLKMIELANKKFIGARALTTETTQAAVAALRELFGKEPAPGPAPTNEKVAKPVEEEDPLIVKARAARARQFGLPPPRTDEPAAITRYTENLVAASRKKYLGEDVK